jgi:hypothetical protein
MSRTVQAGIAVVVVALLVGGIFLLRRHGSAPPVVVTLRISITPQERSDLVAAQANSARFKYLIGKQAGLKPALAQKLSVKPIPNTSLLEARVGVLTRDEGRRYAEAFVPTLQPLCGNQVRLALADQSVR